MDWLLLLHQIPPQPPYFRAKVLRRLNQLGALPIKNSAYVLPANDETVEDMQWLRREIEKEGGEGWLFRTEAIGGLSDETLRESFRALRGPEYAELAENGQQLLNKLRGGENPEANVEVEFRKLKRRLDDIRRIDFFVAVGRRETETIMESIERILNSPAKSEAPKLQLADMKGRTWVTRRGIRIDRMASAWLIRRFIDPAAKFSFVDSANYRHAAHEIRFDMFEGEFTHEGDMCTFEVLLQRIGLTDRGLKAVAEVVHDIDIKDGKFQRVEVAGIVPVIEGIAMCHTDDVRRMEEATTLFEALHARLSNDPPKKETK